MKKLITHSEEDDSLPIEGKDCPTCNGTGILGDYYIVSCYQCKGIGKVFKGHKWVFLNI